MCHQKFIMSTFGIFLIILSFAESVKRFREPLFKNWEQLNKENIILKDDHLNYRLPNDTVPLHYDIELTTNVHKGEQNFSGVVMIDILILNETQKIVLHSSAHNYISASLIKDEQSIILDVSYDDDREFLTLTPLNKSLIFQKNSLYTISISYKAELRNTPTGFFLSEYINQNNSIRYFAATQFEAIDARHAFPCYDEPDKRANFTIKINHDSTYNALSNMPINETVSTPERTVFLTSPSMPTYLVGFIICEFEWTETLFNSISQRIYSLPGTQQEHEWSSILGIQLLDVMAEYFDVDFALPKLDHIALPGFNNDAMENWGIITYNDKNLLYDGSSWTVETQNRIATVLAHEYAHQWFGNYVTMKWWTYLWLKEGFATLYSFQIIDNMYPEWNIDALFQIETCQRALFDDGMDSFKPMTHYVEKRGEINSQYDGHVYAKAPCVLYMWQNALTDEIFHKSLIGYLKKNEYGTVDENDIFDAFQKTIDESNYKIPRTIKNMLSTWTQQTGYPIITVKRNYKKEYIEITQNPFTENDIINRDKTWIVPINYVVASNPDFSNTEATHYLFNKTKLVIKDNTMEVDDWIILNKQATGYYRVNYDEKNWKLIINELKTNYYIINEHNRAQLIDDAFALIVSKKLKHDIFINLVTYLTHEDQYAPWAAFEYSINTIEKYLNGDKQYNEFRIFLADIVKNIYNKLRMSDMTNQHLRSYTRTTSINLACIAGIPGCLKEMNTKLLAEINNSTKIESNLISTIYCNALRYPNDQKFDYIFNQLLSSDNDAQKMMLLDALGCAQNEKYIQKFLTIILGSNNLSAMERSLVLFSIYSHGQTGVLKSIEFLEENWRAYIALRPYVKQVENDLLLMADFITNTKLKKKFLNLVNRVKNSELVSQDLETNVKIIIESNFIWIKDNRDRLIHSIKAINKIKNSSQKLNMSIISIILALLMVRLN